MLRMSSQDWNPAKLVPETQAVLLPSQGEGGVFQTQATTGAKVGHSVNGKLQALLFLRISRVPTPAASAEPEGLIDTEKPCPSSAGVRQQPPGTLPVPSLQRQSFSTDESKNCARKEAVYRRADGHRSQKRVCTLRSSPRVSMTLYFLSLAMTQFPQFYGEVNRARPIPEQHE